MLQPTRHREVLAAARSHTSGAVQNAADAAAGGDEPQAAGDAEALQSGFAGDALLHVDTNDLAGSNSDAASLMDVVAATLQHARRHGADRRMRKMCPADRPPDRDRPTDARARARLHPSLRAPSYGGAERRASVSHTTHRTIMRADAKKAARTNKALLLVCPASRRPPHVKRSTGPHR